MDKITIKNPSLLTVAPKCVALSEGIECEVESLADVSDGYHSIAELYDHRITLFIALCRMLHSAHMDAISRYWELPWRSKTHSDGSFMDGWFIMGIGKKKGEQMSYHLPLSRWDETGFAETLDKAPEWDGHTSADVLERLKSL